MLDENKIKSLLTILITIALVIYHAMNYFFPFISNSDVFSLYKIAQFLVLFTFIMFAIYNNFLARLLLGKDYVAGDYKGESSYYIREEETDFSDLEKHRLNTINFCIQQSLFKTTITGNSLQFDNDTPISNWCGVLYKHENNTLYFALSLSSVNSEFGVLQLHFNNSQVHGFYYSGEAGNKFTYRVQASKL